MVRAFLVLFLCGIYTSVLVLLHACRIRVVMLFFPENCLLLTTEKELVLANLVPPLMSGYSISEFQLVKDI